MRDRVPKGWLGIFALLLSTATLQAQSTVRQAEKRANEFESPMEVTIPLAGFEKLEPSQSRIDKTMAGAFCEDVEIQSVTITRGKTRKGLAQVLAVVSLYVRRSADKDVTVRLEWLNGEEAVAHGERRSFDAEEGKTATAKIRFSLPEAVVASAEQSLRLTLEVRTPSD